MTYSLRRKMFSTGLVFAWYSRSRTASASSVSSSRLISSPPQASHLPSVDGLLSIRLVKTDPFFAKENSTLEAFAGQEAGTLGRWVLGRKAAARFI